MSYPPHMPSGRYPRHRMRRLRSHVFIRDLVASSHLHAKDFILPLFVVDKASSYESIAAMPGVYRLGFQELLATCEEACDWGIVCVALFPVIATELKDAEGSQAYAHDGLVPRCIQKIKTAFPQLGVMADVALDSYTDHGHDGWISADGDVDNDITVSLLVRQARVYAHAGADILAPSDMMDGRVGKIRDDLEEHGCVHTKILSYAVKYASALYSPFRSVCASSSRLGPEAKRTYQMDVRCQDQALLEVACDLDEGADMVMIKPGSWYLDVVAQIKSYYRVPTFVYHVSGEYAMIKAAAQQGWIDEKAAVLELMHSFKRAGSDGIVSYYALQVAKWLRSS